MLVIEATLFLRRVSSNAALFAARRQLYLMRPFRAVVALVFATRLLIILTSLQGFLTGRYPYILGFGFTFLPNNPSV